MTGVTRLGPVGDAGRRRVTYRPVRRRTSSRPAPRIWRTRSTTTSAGSAARDPAGDRPGHSGSSPTSRRPIRPVRRRRAGRRDGRRGDRRLRLAIGASGCGTCRCCSCCPSPGRRARAGAPRARPAGRRTASSAATATDSAQPISNALYAPTGSCRGCRCSTSSACRNDPRPSAAAVRHRAGGVRRDRGRPPGRPGHRAAGRRAVDALDRELPGLRAPGRPSVPARRGPRPAGCTTAGRPAGRLRLRRRGRPGRTGRRPRRDAARARSSVT